MPSPSPSPSPSLLLLPLLLPLMLLNLLFILAVNSCSVLRYCVMFCCVVKALISSFDCHKTKKDEWRAGMRHIRTRTCCCPHFSA